MKLFKRKKLSIDEKIKQIPKCLTVEEKEEYKQKLIFEYVLSLKNV